MGLEMAISFHKKWHKFNNLTSWPPLPTKIPVLLKFVDLICLTLYLLEYSHLASPWKKGSLEYRLSITVDLGGIR